MWEWRCFSTVKIDFPWDISENTFLETRVDRYITCPDTTLGIKVRDKNSDMPLLEIKKLNGRKGQLEEWEKLVQFPVEPNLNEQEIHDMVLEYVERLYLVEPDDEVPISQMRIVDVRKQRVQVSNIDLDLQLGVGIAMFELADLKFNDTTKYTVGIESNTISIADAAVSAFLSLVDLKNSDIISGYPAFLLNYKGKF